MPDSTTMPSSGQCRTTKPRRERLQRVFPTMPGAIPVGVFSPVLKRLLKAPDTLNITQLESASGIPARTILRIRDCSDRSVTFDVADSLLTALGQQQLWHEPPLAHFLPPPPPKSELLHPMTMRQFKARQRALERRDGTDHEPQQRSDDLLATVTTRRVTALERNT